MHSVCFWFFQVGVDSIWGMFLSYLMFINFLFACAGGTAMQCERVGSRLISKVRELHDESREALFWCLTL